MEDNIKKVEIKAEDYPKGGIYIDPGAEITFTCDCAISQNVLQDLVSDGLPLHMPKETTTYLYEKRGNLNVGTYKNGNYVGMNSLLPAVTDVKIINDTVVVVYFADGTKEKAVLNYDDNFSLEQGISICLTKKMLSARSENNGSSVYNKLIKHCLNVYKRNRKAEHEAENNKRLENEKEQKLIAKAKAKRARKAAAKREEQIEIQKEAYLRAMNEYNGTSA